MNSRSRRSVSALVVVALLVAMTLAGLVLGVRSRSGSGLGFGGRDRIAILEIEGIIADDAKTLQQIHEFRDDPSIKGYVIAVNSPGGVVGPSQSIYAELRRLREETGMPLVASIGSVGASGGYYVTLAADTIFALPGSITGSIGVVMEFPDASELLDNVGLNMEVVKSAEYKDAGSPFRPVTEEDRAVLRELIDDVYAQFVEAVQEERGLTPDALASVTDGRIVSGRQALERGLVDRLGNLHDALATAGQMAGLGPDPRVVRPPEDRFSMLDLLLGRASVVDRLSDALSRSGPRLKYVVPW